MKSVVLVGCGNIGENYIKAFLGSGVIANFYCYDLNIKKINILKEKYNNNNICFISKFSTLPAKAELVILATDSKKRKVLIKKLVKKIRFKKIICEKIVEQNYYNLNEILNIFKNVNVYHPLIRRANPMYQKLKKKKLRNIRFFKSNKNWGMACNLIHFIDLIKFLTNSNLKFMRCAKKVSWVKSKRNGYWEVLGEIKLIYSDGSIGIFRSDRKSKNLNFIKVKNKKYYINDDLAHIKIGKKFIKGKNNFISLLMAKEIKKIFNNKRSNLPMLENLKKEYQIFFDFFIKQWKLKKNNDNYVPIT